MFDITPILMAMVAINANRINHFYYGACSLGEEEKAYIKSMAKVSRVSFVVALIFGVIFCICLFFGF